MEIGGYDQIAEVLKIIFGDALASEFTKTLAIFSAAAWVHSWKVSKTIRQQLSELTNVLREDLDHQKKVIAEVRGDVTKIKEHLKLN